MNINITILEDNQTDFEVLSQILHAWEAENNHTISIQWIPSIDDFKKEITHLDCNILFSDISLNDKDTFSGIDACKLLRKNGFSGTIIITTAFSDYVFEGYDVQALQYLLKPISKEKLFVCLNRYTSLYEEKWYFHQKGKMLKKIQYYDIVYIEKNLHDMNIYTQSDRFSERISLNEIEKKLPSYFVRIHKSFIVNVHHIQTLNGTELLLDNGQKLSIGRTYLHQIKDALFATVL